MTIAPRPTDRNTEARPTSSSPIPLAASALAGAQAGDYATASRDFGRGVAYVLAELRAALAVESDRHWFVPDAPDGYYCAACALPEANSRHVSRQKVA